MIVEAVVQYIKRCQAMHVPDDEIKAQLLSAGWQEQDIENSWNTQIALPKPPLPPRHPVTSEVGFSSPEKSEPSMWDAFEHILMFISMYVLATSVALTLHYFVDHYVPTVNAYGTSNNYMASFQETMVRGYLSAIIVSFPLFAFFFLDVNRRTIQHPYLRSLSARKTLIYITLVVTFIVVIANIIGIVYNFLGGSVTTNFFFHFLVTCGVSGIIFIYYVSQVKEDRKLYA